MTKEDDFFTGFDPPVLRVDPIGPTAELRAQVAHLKATISQIEWCAIRSSESESTGTIHRYYCCPVCSGDKRWGKHLDGCSLWAALATCPAPEEENP